MSTIGARVKAARLVAGFTQDQLARAIDRTSATISNIERDIFKPNATTLERIAEALAIPVSELITSPGDNLPSPRREQEWRAIRLLRHLPDPALQDLLTRLEAMTGKAA